MTTKNLFLLIASYPDIHDAEADWREVKALHEEGQMGHVSAGIVQKDAHGKLRITRHDTTAKHLAWGGIIIGAALGTVWPPLGYAALAGATLDAVTLGVIGGLVGHLWQAIPRDDLKKFADTLDAGEAGLIVVAVDKVQDEIDAVVSRAAHKAAKKYDKGDIDGALAELQKGSRTAEALQAS